jgi:hypothetical protein
MENTRDEDRMKTKKDNRAMRSLRNPWLAGSVLILTAVLTVVGCYHTPIDTSDYAKGPAPLRMPSPARDAEGCDCYQDSLTGGQIFSMYCSYCHDAPSLAERPFSNFKNVATHMRVRANLTGKEYAKLMEFLQRWHDVPSPEQREVRSPKRFLFSQPIPELRQEQSKAASDPVAGPRPGATDEASPGQPPPGSSPREGR